MKPNKLMQKTYKKLSFMIFFTILIYLFFYTFPSYSKETKYFPVNIFKTKTNVGPTCDENLNCTYPKDWKGLSCNNEKNISFLINPKIKKIKLPYISEYLIKFITYDLSLSKHYISWNLSLMIDTTTSYYQWQLNRSTLELQKIWEYNSEDINEVILLNPKINYKCELTNPNQIMSIYVDKISEAKKNNKL